MNLTPQRQELRRLAGDDFDRLDFTPFKINHYLSSPLKKLGRKVFKAGNTKLGSQILTFGIPAISTCPGSTELCRASCYATKFMFKDPVVQRSQLASLCLAVRDDFAQLACEDLKNRKAVVVRPHDAGDLFSVKYAMAWLEIFKANQDRKFFLYTRSWRLLEFHDVLKEMSGLKHVRMWYSVDAMTGKPTRIPKRARLAYMQTESDDLPPYPVDLVFRDYSVRRTPAKFVAGALVCPYENGSTAKHTKESSFDCLKCKMCWQALEGPMDARNHKKASKPVKGARRVSLPVL